ncbi:MAG: DUF3520 domain-containing protein [Streptosporangiales bacterium]|nr:DUF3520 domain-containing protein [Streptosporangiales bacterium]
MTENGAAAYADAAARLAKAEEKLLAPLAPDERDQLHGLVSRLSPRRTPQERFCREGLEPVGAPARLSGMRSSRSNRQILVLAALGLAAAAGLSACSGSDDVADNRAGIDARSYYEEYKSSEDEDSVAYGTAPEAATAEGGGGRHVPGVLEDNTFIDAGTSDFVEARRDPLSTFALDVDTGSYSVGRELLSLGRQPPAASIRPEEWVNAFDYGYAAPTESDLGVYVDGGVAPSASETRLIRVGVKAREVTEDERPPVALTLVVDTSGSMDIRERLGLVKSSLALLAKHLSPDDTIAIVTYEDNARALLGPTPVKETKTILDAIDGLEPGGSTNMEAGLRLAYDQAREAYREDAINAVVLAPDGVANVGTTGPDSLAKMIQRAGDDGVHLVTVGYGMGNYNDDLMEQLADQGDGFYAYVDTFDEAEQLFVEDLTGTLTVVARDARTQVRFDPELVDAYRLIGYDNRAVADDDFTEKNLDAGEIGAGHDVTALYEVRLNPEAVVEPYTEIGTVHLRWDSVDSGRAEKSATPITAAEGEPDGSFRLAATVADLAQLLKGASPITERDIALEDLAAEAVDLDAEGVDGAAELVEVIKQAQRAQ